MWAWHLWWDVKWWVCCLKVLVQSAKVTDYWLHHKTTLKNLSLTSSACKMRTFSLHGVRMLHLYWVLTEFCVWDVLLLDVNFLRVTKPIRLLNLKPIQIFLLNVKTATYSFNFSTRSKSDFKRGSSLFSMPAACDWATWADLKRIVKDRGVHAGKL